MEPVRAVAQVSGKWFFDNNVLVALEGGDGDFLMGGDDDAAVDHVHVVEQRVQRLVAADAPFFRKGLRLLGIEGIDPLDVDVGAIDLRHRLVMKPGGKSRADNPRPNRFLFHGRIPSMVR